MGDAKLGSGLDSDIPPASIVICIELGNFQGANGKGLLYVQIIFQRKVSVENKHNVNRHYQ